MEINIAKNISELRKRFNVTQEQLAAELNISAQAISKWETNSCMPDTAILPSIAEYFHVSVDYLFYGKSIAYDELYEQNLLKVSAYPQMSKEAYEEALAIFASAHHGISRGNIRGKELMYDEPSHISDMNGLSMLSGKGYGAIVTRRFFECIDTASADFTVPILSALGERTNYLVMLAVISMSDISFNELKEKLNLDDISLRTALDALITAGIVTEKQSKHKSLGTTYDITSMYHTCLCILAATMEMQRISLKGISCCMGYGDYPINIEP